MISASLWLLVVELHAQTAQLVNYGLHHCTSSVTFKLAVSQCLITVLCKNSSFLSILLPGGLEQQFSRHSEGLSEFFFDCLAFFANFLSSPVKPHDRQLDKKLF